MFNQFCFSVKGSDASWKHDQEPPEEVLIVGIGVFGCEETRDVIVRPVWESEACNCG